MSYGLCFLACGKADGVVVNYLIRVDEEDMGKVLKCAELKKVLDASLKSRHSDYSLEQISLPGHGQGHGRPLREDEEIFLNPGSLLQLLFSPVEKTIFNCPIPRWTHVSLIPEVYRAAEASYMRSVGGFLHMNEESVIKQRMDLYRATIPTEPLKSNRLQIQFTFGLMIGLLRENILRRRYWVKLIGWRKMKEDLCFRAFHALMSNDAKGKFLELSDFIERLEVPPKKFSKKVKHELFTGFLENRCGASDFSRFLVMSYDLFQLWCAEYRNLASSLAGITGYDCPSEGRTNRITAEIKLSRAERILKTLPPPRSVFAPSWGLWRGKLSISKKHFISVMAPLQLTPDTVLEIFDDCALGKRMDLKLFSELYPNFEEALSIGRPSSITNGCLASNVLFRRVHKQKQRAELLEEVAGTTA